MSDLNEVLSEIYGNSVTVIKKTPVSGGDINRAYTLLLSDGSRLFMKVNRRENGDFFRAEAEGLEAMKRTGAVNVPDVIGGGEDRNESFLLLEHVAEGRRTRGSSEKLGRGLAEMHMYDTSSFTESGKYGFRHDNYIGAGFQCNTPGNKWSEFFINRRLRPQFEKAASYWDADFRKCIERFLDKAERYLEEPDRPSLLHGDLWAGNYMIDTDGEPWLIDPAVYVGHREADLAMTELFGGFDRSFYDAYRESAGIDPYYSDRRDIYNLYHLLNHLNLFGGSYLYSVKSVVSRYA